MYNMVRINLRGRKVVCREKTIENYTDSYQKVTKENSSSLEVLPKTK